MKSKAEDKEKMIRYRSKKDNLFNIQVFWKWGLSNFVYLKYILPPLRTTHIKPNFSFKANLGWTFGTRIYWDMIAIKPSMNFVLSSVLIWMMLESQLSSKYRLFVLATACWNAWKYTTLKVVFSSKVLILFDSSDLSHEILAVLILHGWNPNHHGEAIGSVEWGD